METCGTYTYNLAIHVNLCSNFTVSKKRQKEQKQGHEVKPSKGNKKEILVTKKEDNVGQRTIRVGHLKDEVYNMKSGDSKSNPRKISKVQRGL